MIKKNMTLNSKKMLFLFVCLFLSSLSFFKTHYATFSYRTLQVGTFLPTVRKEMFTVIKTRCCSSGSSPHPSNTGFQLSSNAKEVHANGETTMCSQRTPLTITATSHSTVQQLTTHKNVSAFPRPCLLQHRLPQFSCCLHLDKPVCLQLLPLSLVFAVNQA